MRGFVKTTLSTLAAIALLGLAGGASAATDEFASACLARGKTSPKTCECQAKLAKASFNAEERKLAIGAITGSGESFRAGMAKMPEAKRQTFVGKMQTLSRRTEAECR